MGSPEFVARYQANTGRFAPILPTPLLGYTGPLRDLGSVRDELRRVYYGKIRILDVLYCTLEMCNVVRALKVIQLLHVQRRAAKGSVTARSALD